MEENKNKYKEKQWEDIIPRLYKKFGDTRIASIGCTPKEYYARMTSEELRDTLCAHLGEDVPVPEFLCAEIEGRGEAETLLPLLDSRDTLTAQYAINILGDNPLAYNAYFDIIAENPFDEEVCNDIIEIFKLHADEMKDKVLQAYNEGKQKEYMLEILSRVKTPDEKVFDILLSEFKTDENMPMRASYLASYGDERALPVLLNRIEDRSIGFVEFQELKYAIEALGGEYDEERDFSADKDFLAVEVATSKLREKKELS